MALRLWREEDAEEWGYRGEGAANLVLGYCGSCPNLVLSLQVSSFLFKIFNYFEGIFHFSKGVY